MTENGLLYPALVAEIKGLFPICHHDQSQWGYRDGMRQEDATTRQGEFFMIDTCTNTEATHLNFSSNAWIT
jgi:hypothetical protein